MLHSRFVAYVYVRKNYEILIGDQRKLRDASEDRVFVGTLLDLVLVFWYVDIKTAATFHRERFRGLHKAKTRRAALASQLVIQAEERFARIVSYMFHSTYILRASYIINSYK